ncbi:T9SS type A sorting domain-containing protein, partial [bacterium]|nr:T9SS type A sorting domain-containing protein [bacterium]
SFLVFRDDSSAALAALVASVTQFADSSLNDPFFHEYRIYAANECGLSLPSMSVSAQLLPLFDCEESIPDTVFCMQEFFIDGRICDSVDSLQVWLSIDGGPFETSLGGFTNPTDPFSLTIPDAGRVLVPSRLMILAYRSTRVDTALSNEFILDCLMDIDKPYRPLPAAYTLYQNYPNPFNATTEIVYDLPTPDFAKLAVYNVMGREVAVLTNEIRTAGNHEITFDASLLPSGIYFYRLEAGDFTAIKKMVLMK